MIPNPTQFLPSKNHVRTWIITVAALLPVLGWTWSVIDNRYVRRDEFTTRVVLDSINNVTTQAKLDDLLKRLTQIQCGAKVAEGCR